MNRKEQRGCPSSQSAETRAPKLALTMPCPASSDLIQTLDDARAFYAERLAGARTVTCGETKVVRIYCPPDLTHIYSIEEKDAAKRSALSEAERVTREIGAYVEVRRFDLDRARLMGRVLPTISNFLLSVAGPRRYGKEHRLLFGSLPDARYMKVVLQPFAGQKRAHRLITAFPVSKMVFDDASRDPAAKFPP